MHMKAVHWLAITALAAPAAMAQGYYVPGNTLTRDELRDCVSFDSVQVRKRERLEREQAQLERENDSIARSARALAEDLGRLQSGDPGRVAEYNARQAEHNRFVDKHNSRVAEVNARLASLSADNLRLTAQCSRPYLPGDMDAIAYERSLSR
jgi:hypothetical protein